ncbi:SEL1-like repeat protein [Pelagibacterium sediminicola]|uniref:SEL1-like repeat protein n=1 Tax=Pelagibacterium sediminicola TaxID=2248761 RepID=UPI000E30EFC4|nr:SEL1-like repeat protein [Pelagibacterium sediminicola]
MARTNPHHDWDEPARTSRGGVRQDGAEWESLRNEIVALLDHVEDQVAGVRQPRHTPPPPPPPAARPRDTGRRHEALRSVRLAVDRLADRSEPETPPSPDPANRVVRDSVADAINQIRARQTGARSPAPAAQTAELSGFADTLNALGERIGRFEAEMASRFDRFANQPDIAAQVAQLSEVIEMLAGAVSNNGEVQRIDQLADTVDRLASYQVESTGRNQQFQDRQDAGLKAIQETVRNIYDRIDALEMARGGDSPEIERIGREVGAISSAIAASGSDAGEILARIDALQDRIAAMPPSGGAGADLGFSIEELRDAIVSAIEPQLAALAAPAMPGDIETQLRHIAQTVEKTSAQLETLAALRGVEAQAPDLDALADLIVERTRGGIDSGAESTPVIAKADLDALEQRLAALFSAEPETAQPDPGLNIVRDSIAQVDNRLGRLEAMLNTRHETPAAEARPRRREPSDTMPADPVSGAPRKVLSEDPAITLETARTQAAPGFNLDPETIARPVKPQSSFADEPERPFAAERAEPGETAGSRPLASRSNFIEAARRSARQQPEEESASRSLIARALSRFQKAEAEEAYAPQEAEPAPAIEPQADPFVAPPVETASEAEGFEPGFIARNRRALLLGAALVVVIALAVPLVLNRVTGGDAPIRQAATPPVPAEAPAPEPQAPAQEPVEAAGDVSSLMSGVRMIDAPSALSPATLDAGAVDPIQTAALGNPPDRYIDRTMTASIPDTPPATAVLPEISVPDTIEPELLRTAAEAGDSKAQFEIGAIFTEGHVVEQDFAQAAAWYERSAAQGFAPAQYRLGNLYESGRGVDRDLELARLWYQRAAEAGNRMSMHNLASLYAGGELQTQDFEAAAHWFEEAGARGLTDSQFNLGMLHARGLGVEQSFEDSYFWFSLAARSGDEDAVTAREDVARSLEAETINVLSDRLAAWQPAEIDMAANFAPIGTWDAAFDPGQAIANREVVERVQMLLGKLGYDVGQPDGLAGPRTREAILAFERATGMNEKGEVNPRLLAVLGSQPV